MSQSGGAQFTPGPWVVRPDSTIESKDGVTIASFVDNEADMPLIAAAPAMYEALRQAYAYLAEMGCDCEEGKSCGDCIVCQCETALAQAEGRDK